MDAISLLAEGTMRAASQMVNHTDKFPKLKHERDTNIDRCCALISGSLKQTLKASMPVILKEWKDATEANVSELWLKELLNAQCNQYALEALRIVEEEL